MKSRLLIAVLAMTISGMVFSQSMSFGAIDCGEWVKSQLRTPPHQANRAWLLGFLSGLNQDKFYKDALSKVSSATQIFLWMDNYCKNNPLEQVSDGTYELFNELMKRK